MSDDHYLHRKKKPTFSRHDQRGTFFEIVNEGPWETIVHGSMKVDSVMGNHYHKHCVAFFYLIRGEAEISIYDIATKQRGTIVLTANEGIFFYPYELHVIKYLDASDYMLLKSQRYHDDEADIHHFDENL